MWVLNMSPDWWNGDIEDIVDYILNGEVDE